MTGALDVLARLSEPMRTVLKQQAELAASDLSVDVDLATARRRYREERAYWNEGGPVMAATSELAVPAPHGEVGVRLHRPSGAGAPAACIVYLHGGGFVVGDNGTHDRIMRILADRTGAAVAGVDYHLAPEARFPQPVDESVAVCHYLRDHGDALSLDPDRIALAGDSSGANICLATVLRCRDRSDLRFGCLLLYYGLLGLRDSVSRRLYGGPWDGLTRADLAYYVDAYLADPAQADDPLFDCLNADLSHLPPCFIGAVDLDPLRDDSLALAEILAERGVRHRLQRYEGVLHGFLHYSRMLPAAVQALGDGADFFRENLQTR